MKTHSFWLLVIVSVATLVEAQPAIQRSQIETNVPTATAFDALLRRDLQAYFLSSHEPEATSLEFQLLRDRPTQAGVSYPKYYLWVRVSSVSGLLTEGAVRLAAVDGERFEVTHFMPTSEIQAAPASVNSVFPAALVPAILALARVK